MLDGSGREHGRSLAANRIALSAQFLECFGMDPESLHQLESLLLQFQSPHSSCSASAELNEVGEPNASSRRLLAWRRSNKFSRCRRNSVCERARFSASVCSLAASSGALAQRPTIRIDRVGVRSSRRPAAGADERRGTHIDPKRWREPAGRPRRRDRPTIAELPPARHDDRLSPRRWPCDWLHDATVARTVDSRCANSARTVRHRAIC